VGALPAGGKKEEGEEDELRRVAEFSALEHALLNHSPLPDFSQGPPPHSPAARDSVAASEASGHFAFGDYGEEEASVFTYGNFSAGSHRSHTAIAHGVEGQVMDDDLAFALALSQSEAPPMEELKRQSSTERAIAAASIW
jgi:hypothetical protein